MVEHERAGKLDLFRMDAGLASDRNRFSADAAMADRADLGARVCTWTTTLERRMTVALKNWALWHGRRASVMPSNRRI